jgi:Lipase (class 3)
LFGFFAAADDELYMLLQESPVIVYSIASPYVGNWKFRFAFQYLERQKRLQHMRISNLEDMVTLLPFATPSLAVLSPALTLFRGSAGNLYKHTGIRLQMTKQHICNISYPKDQDASTDEEKIKEIQDAMNSGKSLTQSFYHLFRKDVDRIVMYHSCEEYETRLEKCKSELMKVTLDEIYSNKDIVGDVLDHDFVPRTQPSSYERTKMVLKYWKNTQSSSSSSALVAN